MIYGDEGPRRAANGDLSQAWLRLIKVPTLMDVQALQKSIEQGQTASRKNARIVAFFSEDPRDKDFGAEPVIDWSKRKQDPPRR